MNYIKLAYLALLRYLKHITPMKKSSYQKDKGTGGKACWKGYKRVGANGCTKVKKRKK
jgi:hypothetical protein